MKYLLPAVLFLLSCNQSQQSDRLQKLWETDAILATPESVLPDAQNNSLFVSLIDGEGWDMDGKGGIAKLSADGMQYDSTWVTGLNAPKGMGVYNGRLYAADIQAVAVIDIENAKVIQTISIPGATGLNDITVTPQGVVYVSDMKEGKVWRIENDTPQLYLENLEMVNGLKYVDDHLYIGANQKLVKANDQKQLTTVVELPQSIDGIEPVENGGFLISAWAGYLYLVQPNGEFETLLETHQIDKNVADIGYDPRLRIVYVPTFKGNSVAAYQLK